MADNIVFDCAEFFNFPTLSDFDFLHKLINYYSIFFKCYCVKIYDVYVTYTIQNWYMINIR